MMTDATMAVPSNEKEEDYTSYLKICKKVWQQLKEDFTEEEWDVMPSNIQENLWYKAVKQFEEKPNIPDNGTFWRLPSKKVVIQIISRDTYVDLQQDLSSITRIGMGVPDPTVDKLVSAVTSSLYPDNDGYVHYRIMDIESGYTACFPVDNLYLFYQNFTQITDEGEIGLMLLRLNDE